LDVFDQADHWGSRGDDFCFKLLKTIAYKKYPSAGKKETLTLYLAGELKGEAFPLTDCGAQQIEAVISQASSKHGHLDGVVNRIGSLLLKPAHLTTQEEFETVITTNLTSVFATVRSAAQARAKHDLMKVGGECDRFPGITEAYADRLAL